MRYPNRVKTTRLPHIKIFGNIKKVGEDSRRNDREIAWWMEGERVLKNTATVRSKHKRKT